jgi:hypothetical protein
MLQLAEKKADLTHEVGKSALQKKQFATAARWLEQSYQIFDDLDPEMLSSDLCDLRLVVMLDYGKSDTVTISGNLLTVPSPRLSRCR